MTSKEKNKKNIIVVIGPGRSGTSITMQVLEALGMTTSAEMTSAKEHNPCGAFEDSEIFAVQEKLLYETTPDSMRPPNNWLDTKHARLTRKKLKDIIPNRISISQTIFGFKDPRTALFIPMWTTIFNELNVTPLYILATRKPEAVINSKFKQFNVNESVSELFWLSKNTEALYQTGCNCFIVHYEDWFTNKASEVAKNLLEFTGLDRFWDKNKSVTDTIRKIVKPNLNRAVYNDYEVRNRYVRNLQKQLEQCHGNQFDHQALMDVVMECRKGMDEFSGWAIQAQRFFKQKSEVKNSRNITFNPKLTELAEANTELAEANTELVTQANKCLQEHKDLVDENENLRIKISVQTKEYKNLKESEQLKVLKRKNERKAKKIFSLQTSTSFQLGQILVNAITKPGKNTILLPFHLLRTILASRIVKL